jgi:hypothetical protein
MGPDMIRGTVKGAETPLTALPALSLLHWDHASRKLHLTEAQGHFPAGPL